MLLIIIPWYIISLSIFEVMLKPMYSGVNFFRLAYDEIKFQPCSMVAGFFCVLCN
jgi:hypothetical protein